MIVCPVCEHPQPRGAECEVCGKRLAAGPVGALPVAPVEGLEPTLHGAGPATTPAAAMPELEPTAHGAVEVRVERTPDVEQTRMAPVDVDVAPAPDLERTHAGIPGDAPTAVPALVLCRYCRTPSAPGERICDRCGMRLPTFETAAPDAAAAGRRCSCGALVTQALCPVCGARA